MKIIIIGLGSMGKRRMRLLHEIAKKEQLDIELLGTDGRADRRKEAEDQAAELGFEVKTYESLKDAAENNNDIDAAVISTSPLSHAAIIKECLSYGLNVFTELNLVTDGYEENMALAKDKGLTLFLSSTPIYRDEMKYITAKVQEAIGKSLNYTYHVGQYLPDWHPWESYKDFFIGNKRTNGCREIFAVELPWMVKAFGEIESVSATASCKTDLDIDFNDCYNVLIKHKSGHTGSFTVDVVSRPPVRDLKIIGEEFCITWDGSPQDLKEYTGKDEGLKSVDLYTHVEHRAGYNPTIVENMYVTELLDFLAVLKGEKEAEYSFEEDSKILKIIDKIEV
ncbi:MAG: Gfo/Idh/MocA family oxidoreductase [Lachnospiraceae bacterium]|nr:Gfo/Idh/MocA family oxidoreductase [Lachnospiraceae bacterium]